MFLLHSVIPNEVRNLLNINTIIFIKYLCIKGSASAERGYRQLAAGGVSTYDPKREGESLSEAKEACAERSEVRVSTCDIINYLHCQIIVP